jgi:hypothetical protein
MIRCWRLAALLVFLLPGTVVAAGWSTPGRIHGQESVTVRGMLVNGTEGGKIAAGLPVALHSFGGQASSVTTVETTTEESGAFQFDAVVPDGDIGYALTTEYGGMRYSMLIGPEDLAATVELLVYESTQDLGVIRVTHQALVITNVDEAEQRIEAVEFINLSNISDRTLVPDLSGVGQGQFSFLRFSLPPRAAGFDIQSDLVGGEVIPVGTGFGLTSPVTPGEHNLSFSFNFPYQGNVFAYQQNLLQGADIYQVMVPQRLGQLEVGSLEAIPAVEVEGSLYRVWQGRDFAPGQGVEVELTNLPRPSAWERLGRSVSGAEFWIITIPGTLAVVLLAVLLYGGFWMRRTAVVDGPDVLLPANGNRARRESLVREVAELDEKFLRGQVPDAEYQARRVRLKTRILAEARLREGPELGPDSDPQLDHE